MRNAEIISVDRIGDPSLGWMPLQVQGALANSVDDISHNIEHAISIEYIPFNELLGTKSGAVAIVGSGPSLKTNWQELQNFDGDIIACNASCQFLLEKGIVPTYMFCFDADPLVMEFFTPRKDITYLMASRCVPAAFEILKGCKIVVWHAAGDENICSILEKNNKMEPMVAGGSASVTRAMVLAIPMGYKNIHVYGADSSFANGETHIRKSTTNERRMAIKCGGRVFEVAPWMTLQVDDLKKLVPLIKYVGVTLFFHGDGLLQHVAKELGFKTDYNNVVQQWLHEFKRDWKHKATILWQHV
jgi:uncharacterized Rossmann fold enzyme